MVKKQSLPSSAIVTNNLPLSSHDWFEYPVKVHPHHTDYAGVVWHGTYLTWMEETRVEALRSLGINYVDLVAMGCELPVVDLSIRYHRALKMGAEAIVRARMMD
jgi:acyl-CoA thioester hydrolase